MENTLTEFGSTLVLGGFLLISIVAIAAILHCSKLIPISHFTRKINITKYGTLSAVPVFVLCYIFGLLLEDSSNPILQKTPLIQEYTAFANEDKLREKIFIEIFDDKYKRNNLMLQSDYEEKYHRSKNHVYMIPEYFKELSKIQDRIYFTRSFCLSILVAICLFPLVTISILVYRIKLQLLIIPSWSKFITYSATFICFYVGLFFVGERAYAAEERAFASRVFGYCLSLQEVDDFKNIYHIKLKYLDAIHDAERPEPSETCDSLVAITLPDEGELIWDDNGERVLVVTWTDFANWTNRSGYDLKVGKPILAEKEIWVTVVPELKNFFVNNVIKKDNIKLKLRLEQLLGLPPFSIKTKFVEIWVKPDDLFRPSPDPGITDHVAELKFPLTPNRYEILGNKYNKYIEWYEMYYKKWFNDLETQSYKANGFPWTRLGYTYDWGGNPDRDDGLSEFVIKKRATIEIKSITRTQDYCR